MTTKTPYEIPIVFCSDGKFISHVMTTMLSVIKANPNIYFQFYLLGTELTEPKKSAISNKVKSLGSKFDFIKLDDDVFENFPIPHHFSRANYYRLLIPELIPHTKKAIYLDADIIVVSSLTEFLKFDLKNKVLAAVVDPIYQWKTELGMSDSATYFNSGVMLINLDLWKELDITNKAFEFIHNHPDKIRFVDQCALNGVIDGEYLELTPRFNQQAILYREGFDFGETRWTSDQIKEAVDSPILIHYTGSSKPWQYNSNHPRKSEYWKIQKDSPLRLKHPEGMVWSDHIKSLFPNSLKNMLRSLFKFA
ncbi:glycosyltransferase family 8 protein [Algoriphagus persicinus]|uniref:glycosyltransferase family 8 protein n=1 Tax=Algoriphagus persicinus TaxID=3108754 RepID=UPI002B3796C4|nr:glycosyltransferase family 8 protein [Algoriphagus sp. E1-3-M2]MEB2785131.1 glycosyltransferase family 8 protein [Algoriphagus sp. E1-3-M2]